MDIYEKKIRDYMNSSDVDILYKNMLKNLFPELVEPEDKRIIEYLIRYIDNTMKSSELKSKLLAWLEKQGEHANFLSKIQVGDKVTRNEAGVLVNLSQLRRVAKPRKKQGEQKSDWSNKEKLMLNDIIEATERSNIFIEDYQRELVAWLKSLKQRIAP